MALTATSCRRFQAVPLSPADSATALETRSLADPELRALFERALPGGVPRWPIEKWDLGTLTLAALYYHPSLEVARAQWHVAEAGIATAGAGPSPQLVLTPQYVANAAMGARMWDITSALEWPIETAGKRGRRIERAQHLATSSRLSLDSAAWKVRANLRARLLDFVAARARVELVAREHEAQHEVVTLLEQRVQAGAAAIALVAPARPAGLPAHAARGAGGPQPSPRQGASNAKPRSGSPPPSACRCARSMGSTSSFRSTDLLPTWSVCPPRSAGRHSRRVPTSSLPSPTTAPASL